MIFIFGKQCVLTKTERNYNMRNICVRDALCWDPNVLNASCTNCNCCASSAILQLALPVRGLEPRMRIQNVTLKIHFLVPKCLRKRGTKNVFNNMFDLNFKDLVVWTGYVAQNDCYISHEWNCIGILEFFAMNYHYFDKIWNAPKIYVTFTQKLPRTTSLATQLC